MYLPKMKNVIEELGNKEYISEQREKQRETDNTREITTGRGQTQKQHYPMNWGYRKKGQRIQRAGPCPTPCHTQSHTSWASPQTGRVLGPGAGRHASGSVENSQGQGQGYKGNRRIREQSNRRCCWLGWGGGDSGHGVR